MIQARVPNSAKFLKEQDTERVVPGSGIAFINANLHYTPINKRLVYYFFLEAKDHNLFRP